MRNGVIKISKRSFYQHGGFANSYMFRKMRGGVWQYFYDARK